MNSANMLNRALIYSKKSSNHTVLNYLESTGNQCINTGIIPNSTNSVEVCVSSDSTIGQIFFGSEESTGARFFAGTMITGEPTSIVIGLSDLYVIAATGITLNNTTLKMQGNNFYVDGVLKYTGAPVAFTSARSMYLCALQTSWGAQGYNSRGKLYWFKVTNSSGVVIQHLIPVKKADGTYCMYDNVTGVYFYTLNSQPFTGG